MFQVIIYTVILLLTIPVKTFANDNENEVDDRFKLGLGIISIGAAYKDDAGQAGLILYPEYHGERLSIDYDELSYSLLLKDQFNFALLGAIRYQGFDQDDDDLFKGMDDRDGAFELGARFTYTSYFGNISLSGVHDVTDTHDGYELKLAYDYPVQWNDWTFDFILGSKYQSHKLVDYYYGVRDDEITQDRPGYKGDSTQIHFFAINSSYQVTPKFKLVFNLNFDHLPGEIEQSPLVDEDGDTNIIASGFFGANYQF